MSLLSIAVTGGGTGGHTYPAVAAVREARRQLLTAAPDDEVRVVWIGSAAGLEARVAAEEDIRFIPIITGKVRRTRDVSSVMRNVVDVLKVPAGIIQAAFILARDKPNVVLSTGGYVAIPGGIAAWLTRRPLIIHEQTLMLGLANRVLARLATVVALSQESSREWLPRRVRARAVVTGNPLRPELFTGDIGKGLMEYGLGSDAPLVYITGGAQGSRQINELTAAVLPEVLRQCQVIHQCGAADLPVMESVAAQLPGDLRARYRPVAYIGGPLPDVLAAADLVVARSGAGTLAELTALGKPSILLPLVPTGGDEQRRNAWRLAEAAAARVIEKEEATPTRLIVEMSDLMGNPDERRKMAQAARELGYPDAAKRLGRLVVNQLLEPSFSRRGARGNQRRE